jgi:hypothetical protein
MIIALALLAEWIKGQYDFVYEGSKSRLIWGKRFLRIWWVPLGLWYLYRFFWFRDLFDAHLGRWIVLFFAPPLIAVVGFRFLLVRWPANMENYPLKRVLHRLSITQWVLYTAQWALFLAQFWFFCRVIIFDSLQVHLEDVFLGKDWRLRNMPSALKQAITCWPNVPDDLNLIPGGGFIFILFIVLMVFFAIRHFHRIKKLDDNNLQNVISGLCLIGVLFYFSIVSFARTIYPYIPAVKGGGDYTMSLPVQMTFDKNFCSSIPSNVVAGIRSNILILLDANNSSVFLAATNDVGGPDKWRSTTNKPTVYEIRREAIVSITYCNSTVSTNSNQTAISLCPELDDDDS